MSLRDILDSILQKTVGKPTIAPVLANPSGLTLQERELKIHKKRLNRQSERELREANANMAKYKPTTLSGIRQAQRAQIDKAPPGSNRILEVSKHQGVSPTSIPLPNANIQNILWNEFPKEATQSAVALAGENASFDPNAENINADGTIDLGLFQNNSKTLKDLLSKQLYARDLRAAGINSPRDVLGSPEKSAIAARITRLYEEDAGAQPWSWWYGWQDKGYNIDPTRKIQDVANSQYDSGSRAYFRLFEKLKN